MKMFSLFVVLASTLAGCEHTLMNVEYSPSDLKTRLETVDFPDGKITSDEVISYLNSRDISFEIGRSDRSTPCRSFPISEVKEVIQIYRLMSDSSIIRIAVNSDGEVLCVSQLGQHRGI